MKKYIVSAVLAFVLVLPAFVPQVKAAELSSAQINAVISLLQSFGVDQATINSVQSALGGTSTGTTNSCYNFSTNLGMGMNGSAVTALQNALKNDGESVTVTGIYDEQTASAVTGFQQKYASDILTPNGLQYGTGYVGVSTRAKLNSLCTGTVVITPTVPTLPTKICPVWGCTPPTPTPIQMPVTAATIPTITSISPTSGPMGTVIIINGSGFLNNDVVNFNGMANQESNIANIQGTMLHTTIGNSITAGTYNVTVTSPSGQTSNAGTFTVTGVPIISSISPTTGTVGTTVTVSGSGFAPKGNVVVLNGLEVVVANSSDGNTLTFTIPQKWLSQCNFTGTGAGTQMNCFPFTNQSTSWVLPGNYGQTQYTYPLNVFVPNAGFSNSIPFTVTNGSATTFG